MHLSPERLSALADEAPTAAELAHLTGCAECSRERAAQTQSQVLYQNATAYLAQHDTTGHVIESPAAMRTRLAALDGTQQVLHQALTKAPYDPVINGYYLTTVGQREATLRMINTAAPASMRIMSY